MFMFVVLSQLYHITAALLYFFYPAHIVVFSVWAFQNVWLCMIITLFFIPKKGEVVLLLLSCLKTNIFIRLWGILQRSWKVEDKYKWLRFFVGDYLMIKIVSWQGHISFQFTFFNQINPSIFFEDFSLHLS